MGLLVRPAGQTSWTDQLDRPARRTSWTDQLDRPARRTSWTDQLNTPAERTSWTDQLDWPAGQTSCTDQLDGPVLFIWSLGRFAYLNIFLSVCILLQLPSPTKALFYNKRVQTQHYWIRLPLPPVPTFTKCVQTQHYWIQVLTHYCTNIAQILFLCCLKIL